MKVEVPDEILKAGLDMLDRINSDIPNDNIRNLLKVFGNIAESQLIKCCYQYKERNFADDFLSGQRDCRDGKPHKEGMSEAYTRGYSAQYEFEQVTDHYSEIK